MNRILSAILLLILSTSIISAQDDNGAISLKTSEVRKRGNIVNIDYHIIVKNLDIDADRYITLTPTLTSPYGQVYELEQILINGKKRQKLYNRTISLNHEQDYYRVLTANECKDGVEVAYKTTIPYQTWMADAKLELVSELCGCGGSRAEEYSMTISDQIGGITPIPLPTFVATYTAPQKEHEKRRELSGEAYVIFPVSKYILIPELSNNTAELNKIKQSIDYVNNISGVRITNISIEAYASPEGYIQSNITLSENRAKALKNYVKEVYGLPEDIFRTSSKGENWTGLTTALDTVSLSDIQKQEILKIIEIENIATRKNTLKAYSDGKPYDYLLANVYPILRRSEYKISYYIPLYTMEEAKELLKTKPAVLSLDELYQIANSYENGSSDFKEVFDIAVRLYPNDVIANLNAGAIELGNNNIENVRKYLLPNETDPRAYNNLGIMYAQSGDLEKAASYFRKASENGDSNATTNLSELEEYISKK